MFNNVNILITGQMADLQAHGLNIQAATLGDFIERSGILSLHSPNSPSTRSIIDAEALSRMKLGVFLVNAARGELIDKTASRGDEALV